MATPTLSELLLRYGGLPEVALRNLPADANRTLRDLAKAIPEQIKGAGDTALGALQYARELSPAAYRGRAPALDKTKVDALRAAIPELSQLAQETALGGVQNVRDLSPRQLRGSAPRFDTTVANAVGNALVQGVRNLPETVAERPFNALASAAMMMAPTPGRMVRGAAALGKAVRGRRAAPLAAAVEDVAAAPSLAAKYDVAAPPLVEPRLAARAAPSGVIAYHGSPHRFDRFDMSKLGTGEGAQSYGHGLYFAENEDVAKAYRDTFAKTAGARATFDGKTVGDLVLTDPVAAKALAQVENFGGVAEAIARLKRMGGSPAAIRWLEERGAGVDVAPNASMYQVRINADPADFLDYDAPLSGQSARVREAMLSQPEVARAIAAQSHILPDIADKMSGAGAYSALTGWKRGADLSPLTASAANITQRMAGVGLPGIKYFDQGSRATGGGSRNFVVFDDALVDILKRYAVGGAVSGRSH